MCLRPTSKLFQDVFQDGILRTVNEVSKESLSQTANNNLKRKCLVNLSLEMYAYPMQIKSQNLIYPIQTHVKN